MKESDILNEKHCRTKSLIEKFPNKEVITALIEAGSCVDSKTSYGERPLTLAAKAQSLQAVQTLLDNGNAKDYWFIFNRFLGAHFDFTNDAGQSIADLLPEEEFKTLNIDIR